MLKYGLMKVVGVIPARFDSTRFPGKPLAKIAGHPMIEWVYKRTKLCRNLTSVIVATDDYRIKRTVESFGGKVVLTSKECPSGSDRVGEAIKNFDCDIVINIQGDEPLIDPKAIEKLIFLFSCEKDLKVATLITPLTKRSELKNKNVVKVVISKNDFALYFSRSPIPSLRNKKFENFTFYKHIGIYGYKKEFLKKILLWEKTPLEEAESLEQLRILENEEKIKCAVIDNYNGISVDVEGDILKVEREIKKGRISLPS